MNLFGIKKLGFTMIELLVVIAVIGILAVALLSTLNPLEQIRKGRDTRTRTDLSQLLGAIERYNASLGYFPWQQATGEDVLTTGPDIPFYQIGGTGGSATIVRTVGTPETVAEALARLTATSEVKASFVDRLTSTTYATTYLYYDDTTVGGSVIACFTPESQSFQKEAHDRCKAGLDAWSDEFETEVYGVANRPCPDGDENLYATQEFSTAAGGPNEMLCLP